MTAVSTRVIKEARALFAPWCVITAACALPLLRRHYNIGINESTVTLLAILVGIPFLACASYGNEFKHKTMELLMSQPVTRMKIWREKGMVTAFATVIPVLVALLSIGVSKFASDYLVLVYLFVMICSATFWTLFARSTLGGLVLNIGTFFLFFIAITANPYQLVTEYEVAAVLLAYSVLMLWMGCRKLVRFQMTSGFAGTDLMAVAPDIMPVSVASIFRCRSNQMVLNVIRKELQLLKPLWMMAVFFVFGFSVLAVSSTVVPVSKGWKELLEIFFVVFSVVYSLIAMFLAGGASLSEEQESGVFSWHRTLPLSMRLHWLVKLLVGSICGLMCAVALPVLMSSLGHAVLGQPFAELILGRDNTHPIGLLLAVFFLSFWCANAVIGMTRAVVLLVATGGMMVFAYNGGEWVGEHIEGLVANLMAYVLSSFQLNPLLLVGIFRHFGSLLNTNWWVFPPVSFAAIQSYSMFRRLPQYGIPRLARRLAPILAVSFVLALILEIGWIFNPVHGFFEDVGQAVVKFQPGIANQEEVQPISFTTKDLEAASTLHASTERWLRNAAMTVTSIDVSGNQRIYDFYRGISRFYVVTMHLAHGTTCKMTFGYTSRYPKVWVITRECQ